MRTITLTAVVALVLMMSGCASDSINPKDADTLHEAEATYAGCVAKEALSLDDGYDSPVQISDVAASNCASAFQTYRQTVADIIGNPYMAEGYIEGGQEQAKALAATAILHHRQPAQKLPN